MGKGHITEPYPYTQMSCPARTSVRGPVRIQTGMPEGMQCIGLWGLVLPPDIYLTRLGYLPYTLEWLIHQIPLNF